MISVNQNHLFAEPHADFIKKAGKYIITMHISDNDGILWVVGLGVRDDAKPRKGENVCRITVLFDDSGERRLYTARNFNDENILDKKGLEVTE